MQCYNRYRIHANLTLRLCTILQEAILSAIETAFDDLGFGPETVRSLDMLTCPNGQCIFQF